MPKLQLDRRQRETMILAFIGLVSIYSLRFPIENRPTLLLEACVLAGSFIALLFAQSRQQHRWVSLCAAILVAAPVVVAVIGRQMGAWVAFEMTALTAFGAGALAMSVLSHRMRAMSLVSSGFLTLFGTVISDDPAAVGIAILWMTVCVWHLVANHWERIDLCAADNVTRSGSIRPLTVGLAIVLLVLGGLAAHGRFVDPIRLQGFMPTSGGSEWSDPSATHGIGTGDAAVAGKDNAESFGAVESDLFLESTDSTLFDMFSDSLGQPKKKNKWERRQGMTSDKVLEAHSRTARSDKGSNSFSTDRHPPMKHRHLQDVAKNALVQWSGQTGIRLAMERFDTFNGVTWTNNANHRQEKFARVELGEQVWFFEPKTATKTLESDSHEIAQGKLKVIRLQTTRLPVPMMTSGVHIKDIDRIDFFAIDHDGCFFMPGREKVPPLTVVNVAGLRVMEDEIIKAVNKQNRIKEMPSYGPVEDEILRLVELWTADKNTKYEKLRSIVQHLRSEFVFDRGAEFETEQPLIGFLAKRRGGDHMFASAATLMARKIGLESRLVTGLYVRPSAMEIAAGHTNVLPDDVHAWAEIRLDNGRWVEIEPSPGFKEPLYKASWWLTSRRFASQYWPHGLAITTAGIVAYLTRLVWMDWLLTLFWWASVLVGPRRRFGLAVRVIEARARLLGHGRPVGSPPREWLLGRVAQEDRSDSKLRGLVESFCDLADRLSFGSSNDVDRNELQLATGVVGALPMRTLKKTFAQDQS